MIALLVAGLIGGAAVESIGANVAFAAPLVPPLGSTCLLTTQDGFYQQQQGILVHGVCIQVTSAATGGSGPQLEYRYVGCEPNGTAVKDGHVLTDTRCVVGAPRCKLLVEGGQSGTNQVIAYENQTREPGKPWAAAGFWCPQSTSATPVPDAATIRDQVIKLLPKVGVGTTGSPATLVNLQTILWAETPSARSLGRITVVGQSVWLRIAFARASWDFGDGTSETSDIPGKAYDREGDPCAEVMCPDYYGHVYQAAGSVTISLRVSWRATYSLDGTHFAAVDPDPLAGPAATQALLVRQARAVLVPNPGDD